MATVAILSVLVKSEEGALHVARSAPGAMKLWEGICQLLGRKMDMERKYIERLEGEHPLGGPQVPRMSLRVPRLCIVRFQAVCGLRGCWVCAGALASSLWLGCMWLPLHGWAACALLGKRDRPGSVGCCRR